MDPVEFADAARAADTANWIRLIAGIVIMLAGLLYGYRLMRSHKEGQGFPVVPGCLALLMIIAGWVLSQYWVYVD